MYDPALGRQTGEVDFATPEEVDSAVQTAREAFESWRSMSLSKRTAILFQVRELVHERHEDIARILTAEHGKVLSDAMGEVARGIEVIERRIMPDELSTFNECFICGTGAEVTRNAVLGSPDHQVKASLRSPFFVSASANVAAAVAASPPVSSPINSTETGRPSPSEAVSNASFAPWNAGAALADASSDDRSSRNATFTCATGRPVGKEAPGPPGPSLVQLPRTITNRPRTKGSLRARVETVNIPSLRMRSSECMAKRKDVASLDSFIGPKT